MATAYGRRTPTAELLSRRQVRRIGAGHFSVIGRDGNTHYRILATPDGLTSCNCPAGRRGRACWHQARVLLRLLHEATN